MGHRNIVSAIEWLPEHLFTEEIVEAATESEEIEVLNHIPGRFLTPERIGRIIAGCTESWHSFELRNAGRKHSCARPGMSVARPKGVQV